MAEFEILITLATGSRKTIDAINACKYIGKFGRGINLYTLERLYLA